MKKKILTLIIASVIAICCLTGCTEADRVSYNVSKEADNFNVFRRVVVINSESDRVIFELDGYFSIDVDEAENQLEITVETDEGVYKKHFIGLSNRVIYTVEDLSGAVVDRYHYEIHYLPEGNVIQFNFKESK